MSQSSSSLHCVALLLMSVQLASLPAAMALTERETLVRFYLSSNGSRWKKNAGWKEAAESSDDETVTQLPLCSWHGVTCGDGNNKADEGVTGLDLARNHLSGHIPRHLWGMPFLTEVDFQGNNIRDAGFEGIDSLASVAPIESIILSENRLTHITGVSSAPNSLKELRISSNSFDGRFPEEVFHLTKLHALQMSYNPGITGSIPATVDKMENLKELDLSYTSLKDEIPSQIGNLSNLQYLGLDECNLKGSLPEELGNIIGLKYLSVKNNEEDSGKITGPLPAFASLVNLRELYLDGNALTGSIPQDLLKDSVVTDKLVTIGLKNNNLSGKLPSELSRFEKLQLEVQGNRITGIANQLCRQKKWNGGQVGIFGCDAILCPKGTFSTSGRRESEEETCQKCPNGEDDAQHLGSSGCLSSPAVTDFASDSSSSESKSSIKPLTGAGKFFIVLVALAVPMVIGFALRKAHQKGKSRDPTVVIGPDGVAPTLEDLEDGSKMERCVL